MPTHYQVIEKPSEGLYKEKGSKFYAYCFPVEHARDVVDLLDFVKLKHPKARHHCYAYRIGIDGLLFRTVDDGEPSGTAGKPILGQIDAAKITNTLIIVVRYFGGTLLGVSGLIKAYRESAAESIRNGKIVEVEIMRNWKINFDFSIMGKLLFALSELKITITEKRLEAPPELIVQIPAQGADMVLDKLVAKTLRVHQEMITGQRTFDKMDLEEIM